MRSGLAAVVAVATPVPMDSPRRMRGRLAGMLARASLAAARKSDWEGEPERAP